MSKYRKKPKQRPGHGGARSTKAPAATAATPSTGPSRVVRLDPLAPVIARSGRPFDDQAGADPARLPPPSTIAGCLRTTWARAAGLPFGKDLLKTATAGPLLLRQDRILVPKPADALYLAENGKPVCVRAQPGSYEPGCGSDLPGGLMPVVLTRQVRGKPAAGPAWWSIDDWQDFRRGQEADLERLKQNGWSPGSGDRRIHVAIDARGAAADGQLFQTEGLDLADGLDREGRTRDGLRILARCAEPMTPCLVHLGGERRMAALEPEPETRWPEPPEGWFDAIRRAGGLSLTLVTPGLFARGFLPGWLDADLNGAPAWLPGLRLRLRAVAVDRWQAQSGWDLAAKKAKPTRKTAPAGSVYWLDILHCEDPQVLDDLWLTSLCDNEQDRKDGFGLALPAPWTAPGHGTEPQRSH